MSTAPLFDVSTPMGARMQAHAWHTTPIGAPDAWPATLRSAVRTLLATREPRSISWGPSLCLLYNDAYAEMMDGRHPAALGRPLPEVWAEVWDDLRPDVESALAGRATFRGPVPLQRERDGVSVQHWHTVAYSPLHDDDGRVGGVQCLSVNMTDRVIAQLVHERELQSLRRLFDEAPGFMAVLQGPDYTYELANRAFETLVGRSGLVGRSLRRALPRIDGRGYVELLDQVRLTGRAFVGRAMPAQVPGDDGALVERYVDLVFQPIVDGNGGEITRVFVQGADVTDRERALQALREEAREKDRFLAMLAHELRNPLAPISHAAAVLRAGGGDGERGRQLGDVIHRQAAQLARIVDDLVDVARASRGSLHLAWAGLDLRDVVRAALEEVAPLVERKRHRLATQLPAQAVAVWGDAARLTQVVANLLANAARYTPDGGALEIAVDVVDGHAVLAVRDDGIGIDVQMLPRVFELFAQADAGQTQREGGLGIGLALVRHLVELHGGHIVAASDGLGRGACFTVHVPVHETECEPDAALSRERPATC
jgi:signal transduction histidine kinase